VPEKPKIQAYLGVEALPGEDGKPGPVRRQRFALALEEFSRPDGFRPLVCKFTALPMPPSSVLPDRKSGRFGVLSGSSQP